MLIFAGVALEKWWEWKRIPFRWGRGTLLKLHLSRFSRWCHGSDLHWRFWSRLGLFLEISLGCSPGVGDFWISTAKKVGLQGGNLFFNFWIELICRILRSFLFLVKGFFIKQDTVDRIELPPPIFGWKQRWISWLFRMRREGKVMHQNQLERNQEDDSHGYPPLQQTPPEKKWWPNETILTIWGPPFFRVRFFFFQRGYKLNSGLPRIIVASKPKQNLTLNKRLVHTKTPANKNPSVSTLAGAK